jgi:hypothetical protein
LILLGTYPQYSTNEKLEKRQNVKPAIMLEPRERDTGGLSAEHTMFDIGKNKLVWKINAYSGAELKTCHSFFQQAEICVFR